MKTPAVEFPTESYWLAYVREVEENGVKTYCLFDADGMAVMISNDRSSCFFAAVQHGVTVVTRH